MSIYQAINDIGHDGPHLSVIKGAASVTASLDELAQISIAQLHLD